MPAACGSPAKRAVRRTVQRNAAFQESLEGNATAPTNIAVEYTDSCMLIALVRARCCRHKPAFRKLMKHAGLFCFIFAISPPFFAPPSYFSPLLTDRLSPLFRRRRAFRQISAPSDSHLRYFADILPLLTLTPAVSLFFDISSDNEVFRYFQPVTPPRLRQFQRRIIADIAFASFSLPPPVSIRFFSADVFHAAI
jgi:hypothetical protein